MYAYEDKENSGKRIWNLLFPFIRCSWLK